MKKLFLKLTDAEIFTVNDLNGVFQQTAYNVCD